ncbi:MAG: hemolysin III family protein [Acidobacteria bacterium]|nr:hemolysin III family protein [Planctomycetota bacterium]MBE3133279.1 hemolysin III family protein [Acidobacteriota bacterium]
MTPASSKRPQSLGEEIANSVSHGVSLLAAVVATPFLLIAMARRGGPAVVVGASIFAAAMVLLYLTSTLYHALPRSRAKRAFRVLDHSAIFILIAGTYTPFTLGVLRGGWGWTMFGLIWGLAILGIALKAIAGLRYPALSTGLYVGMGWLVVIAIRPLWLHVPAPGLLWLVAGGLAYTAGVAFYAADRFRYVHFVWHLFVIAGTVCHFVAVLKYSA